MYFRARAALYSDRASRRDGIATVPRREEGVGVNRGYDEQPASHGRSAVGALLIVAAGALLVMTCALHSRPDGIGRIARYPSEIHDIGYCLAYGGCLLLFWGAVIGALFGACCVIVGDHAPWRRR